VTNAWRDEVYQQQVRYGLRTTRTLYDRRSDYQRIEVIESEAMGNVLVIDGVFMTSERDEHYYHEMIAHPAMVSCRSPRRVLIIGGGDGGTSRRVLQHARVERLTMVEIDHCVVEASREHLPGLGAWDDPRLELRIGDGIDFCRTAAPGSHDVVILDGTDPVGPARGLFDAAFYRSVAALLAPGGAFVLQSQSPFLSREVFVDIQRTLRQSFARVAPYFGPAPLYAAGTWSFTHASADTDPLDIDPIRAAAVEPLCRYYNSDIHRAAFAVPTGLRRMLAALDRRTVAGPGGELLDQFDQAG
jgi:spermidine synthase